LSGIPSELPDEHPYHEEAAVLRNKLLRWRYDNFFRPLSEPERLPIEPRLFQLYRPLATMAEDAETVAQLQACVLKLHEEMTEERMNSLEARVAKALRTLTPTGQTRVPLVTLASQATGADGVEVSSKDVGAICRSF